MNLQWDRTVQDASGITAAGTYRDYLLWFNRLVMVCAKEKRSSVSLAQAEEDLYKKHHGAGAPMYGQLQYLLGIATSGATIKFYALDLRRPWTGTPIAGEKAEQLGPRDLRESCCGGAAAWSLQLCAVPACQCCCAGIAFFRLLHVTATHSAVS